MSFFREVRFVASAHDPRELPADVGREVAFAGRSNAGKSSAINALTHRKRLAFVSKTPGRTQTINFFECGGERRLVDLPGYGYAAVSRRERAHWAELISAYLMERKSLIALVLIADARHGLKPLDEQLLAWYAPSGRAVRVLLTKADKLSRSDAAAVLKATEQRLSQCYPNASAQLFSATAGTGLAAAERLLHAWLK